MSPETMRAVVIAVSVMTVPVVSTLEYFVKD